MGGGLKTTPLGISNRVDESMQNNYFMNIIKLFTKNDPWDLKNLSEKQIKLWEKLDPDGIYIEHEKEELLKEYNND